MIEKKVTMNKELLNDYPAAIKDALVKYLEVSHIPKRETKKATYKTIKQKLNPTKLARAFMSIMRTGI